MKKFKQTKKIGVAGSFINQLYGNNNTIPVIGEYCTFLHYTDRSVGIVRKFENNTVIIEDCTTIANPNTINQMGHQNWIHTPNGLFKTLVYKNNSWKQASKTVVFTKEFVKTIDSPYIGVWLRKNNPELFSKIYGDHIMPINVIEGITKSKIEYSKVNVIFGVSDYYYDWNL